MRRIALVTLSLAISLSSFAQKDDKTVATINDKKITVGEFKKVYERNLSAIDNEDGKDVAKNLDLYINYKLKVEEAYRTNLDTLSSYIREVRSYKNQLIAPYLQDKTVFDRLVVEAYDRTKYEIRASHILIRLPNKFTPQDTLKAFNKITELRNRALNGEDFAKLAKESSEDPSAKENGGDLGFFSGFRMVYDFEDAAYKTKQGEVSLPFRTRFGYHIVKRTGTRDSKGERQVAHILISKPTEEGKAKADSIYSLLKEGEDFAKLAKKFSDDKKSGLRGGLLAKFGTGRMVKTFEDAAFSLSKEGEISEPVKSRFGWHILKFIKDYPVTSFEEMKSDLVDKVKRTGRAKLSDKAVLDRLKNEYTVKEYKESMTFLDRNDFRGISKDSLQETMYSINEKEIKQHEFVRYTQNRRHLSLEALKEQFLDQEILNYFKDNLKNTNTEFANTLKEYEDGLLLFELMQRKIWNKSSDSIALQSYFDKNKSSYQTESLEKIKGKVMNDYQNFLEKEWIDDLRQNNDVKINKTVLKKLVKYYRKES